VANKMIEIPYRLSWFTK